jgi:hypothetical protein
VYYIDPFVEDSLTNLGTGSNTLNYTPVYMPSFTSIGD